MTQYPLHFFGDSFTAGEELVDSDYVENYPPYTNFWNMAEPSKRRRPSLDHLDENQFAELLATERKQSYAGLLGGVNHGVSGCSMQTISRSVIDHLENTSEKCIIFIQPTNIHRWCEYVDGKWIDLRAGAEHHDQGLAQYSKFRILHSTDYSNLILWHDRMLTLTAYVKSHPNTSDWWIINNGVFNEIESIIDEQKISNKMISNNISSLKEKMINFPQVDNMEYPYYTVGGHVNREAHNKLAQRVEKKLQ